MKVKDLLFDERFEDIQLLAGNGGLNKKITAVTVVDTPDGAQWLSGGEMVVTTAYMLKDEKNALLDFIKFIASKKASALGIKMGRYISEIPAAALKLANKLDLPLMSVPQNYAFADIINPVLSQIVNTQAEKLLLADTIHKKFTELAVSDATIPQILSMLTQVSGVPSAYIDTTFHEIWYSEPSGDLPSLLETIDLHTFKETELLGLETFPVANKSRKFGCLIFQKDTFKNHTESGFQTSIETAATNIILREFMRISNHQLAEQYRAALVHDLLINNIKSEAEIHNRASIYGWNLHSGGVVIVVDINNIKRRYNEEISDDTRKMLDETTDLIFSVSCEEMSNIYKSAYYMKLSDLLIYVVTIKPELRADFNDNIKLLFDRIQTRIKKLPFTITLGVGNYYDNIADVHNSYKEARTAINLGYAFDWYDRILTYNEMTLYSLLLPTIRSNDAKQRCKQILSPLREYDEKPGRDFFETLRQIFNCNWNIASAAEAMHLHANSMKYRYDKICKLLNMDLKKRDSQLIIGIALIVEMLDTNGKD